MCIQSERVKKLIVYGHLHMALDHVKYVVCKENKHLNDNLQI